MKDFVIKITEEMPDDATISEIIDNIVIKLSALKGFNEIDNGKFTTQEELLKELSEW